MSEGYFPEGDPADESINHQHITKERLQTIARLHATISEDDFAGQLHVTSMLLDLMPYSTSLMLAKGELLECLATSNEDPYNAEAKECYEAILRVEPHNMQALLSLGVFLLRVEDRPDLAKPFLEEARQEFKDLYYEAAIAIEDCETQLTGHTI